MKPKVKVRVVALRRTRMGISATYIEKGTKGLGYKYKSPDGETLWNVEWSRGSIGSHQLKDIAPVRS